MTFHYNSSNSGSQRKLPDGEVRGIHAHLEAAGFGPNWSYGQLHDALLAYRNERGARLMINHLEPVFTYLAGAGALWSSPLKEVAQ